MTVQFNLHEQSTADGKLLKTTTDVTKYILDEAKIALVPFYCFGSSPNSSWYRLSVGTCKIEDVAIVKARQKERSKGIPLEQLMKKMK